MLESCPKKKSQLTLAHKLSEDNPAQKLPDASTVNSALEMYALSGVTFKDAKGLG